MQIHKGRAFGPPFMAAPDIPPAPPPGGRVFYPTPTGGPIAVPGAPHPAVDTFDPVRLRQAFEPGGSLGDSGLISLFNMSGNYRGLEAELRGLRVRVTTATGPDLEAATRRITELERVQRLLSEVAALSIRRPDFDRARRDCAAKLLAGAANPPRASEFQEGVRLLDALRRYRALESQRTLVRTQIESMSPGPRDSPYLFLLVTSELPAYELDPDKHPTRDRLEERTFAVVYRTLRDSSDPNDQRIAAAAERLFQHFRDQNRMYDEGWLPDVSASAAMIEQSNLDLETLLRDPDVASFFSRVRDLERSRITSGSDAGGQLSLDLTDSMTGLAAYPGLISNLSAFELNVLSRQTPDQARTLLRNAIDDPNAPNDLMGWGNRYAAFLRRTGDENGAATVEAHLQELQNLRDYLNGLSGADLNRANLQQTAARVSEIARAFQPLEERFLRDALTRKIDQIERLPSSQGNIQPLRDALAALTPTDPASPETRLAAYRDLSGRIDQAAMVRLADARIQLLTGPMTETVRDRDTLVGALGIMAGAPIGSLDAYQSVTATARQQYTALADRYRELRPRLLAGDPAARRELQTLEGSARLTDLQVGAENAATFNQAFLISSMVIASIGLAEIAPVIGIGARGIAGLLPISLGAQRVVTIGLTYVVAGGMMTGINRELTGILMPRAEQGSVLTEWVLNTAMMGLAGGAIRAGRAAFNAGLEWMAVRNIAARTGTALAAPGLATGAELTAIEAEKQTIMRGVLARFAEQATIFGAEYAAIQAFEYVRTVGTLAARGVANPAERAWEHMASFRTQALSGGFMIVMKAHGLSAAPESNPALTDLALRTEYGAIARSLNRELPRFRAECEAAGINEPRDLLAHPELLGRARELLTYQRDLAAIEARAHPNDPVVLQNLQSAQQMLGVIEPVTRFMTGVESVFGDGNRFGVTAAAWDASGSAYTYRPGEQGRIIAALRDLPWVDRANVRIHPNGSIEIPFLASPFNPQPQTVRLIPASAARPAPAPAPGVAGVTP